MSDNKKHTPGPWRYEKDGDRHIRTPDGGSLQSDCQYYPWVSDNEADWYLFAAAPDLLAALEHERACPTCDEYGCLNCGGCTAEAAIAKAQGR